MMIRSFPSHLFFKYPIMMWKNFVSKRPANIGDLVICQKLWPSLKFNFL